MSDGYAARLKDYPNKGVCGLPENFDTARTLKNKIIRLAGMIRDARHIVVLTGAGISTAAGIPDFRGPQGIWTLEQEKKRQTKGSTKKRKLESCSVDFARASPTYTHKAITHLAITGVVKFCITQNVDGLHRRSGLRRDKFVALHGCTFTEKCESCKAEHFRDFDVGGLSFQKTGRSCSLCHGALCDTLLDWDDPLPDRDFERAASECESSDLVLCLGTSLRIEPVGSLPERALRYVIVNLQVTKKDEGAALIIRGRADEVMKRVMKELDLDSDLVEYETERLFVQAVDY